MNSALARLTPSSRYVAPAPVTRRLPATCSAGAAPPVFGALTRMESGVVVVVAPRLSTARALTEYEPAATFVQPNVYGDVVSEPSTVEPLRNSTRATEPPGSLAVAAKYPAASAPEWNFGLDLPATRRVVATWATPTVYDGFEIGAQVFAGNRVCATHPVSGPVRAVFDLFHGCGTSQADGTWDPTAADYAVAGTGRVYTLAGAGGHNTVAADGTNAWVAGERGQRYLAMTDAAQLTDAIDALIDGVPRA
ncbi:hypothetical protein OHA72_46675 [Dactylosporangium sp. NBC_01737]|nr:hypothetical protein OHA72_46675 [Dactylosporangium sp. NBC_01737]